MLCFHQTSASSRNFVLKLTISQYLRCMYVPLNNNILVDSLSTAFGRECDPLRHVACNFISAAQICFVKHHPVNRLHLSNVLAACEAKIHIRYT